MRACFWRINTSAAAERWPPEMPRICPVILRAGDDTIEDRISFRAEETHKTWILLALTRNAEPNAGT